MWILIRKFLLAGLIVLWAVPAAGEYYQYRDQNGVLRFTDDIASIPADQRPDVTTHQSIKSDPEPVTTEAAVRQEKGPSNVSPKQESRSSGGSWQERNARQKQELDRMQAELKKTFEALKIERSKLRAEAPEKEATVKEKATYNNKVEALNLKIAQYEERLAAFNEKVNAYNAQVKK
jgi:predicted RNase H-like nuclease (RuvC/YqgF family)